MPVNITKGNVCEPTGSGNKIIVHCVNDISQMGAGVALSILKKWPAVRSEYIIWGGTNFNVGFNPYKLNKEFIREFGSFQLGNVQFVKVEKDILVANLVGQKDVVSQTIAGCWFPPVRYEAINEGLYKVKEKAIKHNASVHAPLIGCGLAGGALDAIYDIVDTIFEDDEVSFTFYAFSEQDYENLKGIHELELF